MVYVYLKKIVSSHKNNNYYSALVKRTYCDSVNPLICSRLPGSWPWISRPCPHKPGTGDHCLKPTASRWRPKRVEPSPFGGQKWHHPRQAAALQCLTQPTNSQLTGTKHRLPVLLILTSEILLWASELPVEEGWEVRGICGNIPVLVGHSGDGESCWRTSSLLHSLGVSSLYSELPVHSSYEHHSWQPSVVICRNGAAGLSIPRHQDCSDCRVWSCDTSLIPAEKHSGDLDFYLLHIFDQVKVIQKAQHVLRRMWQIECWSFNTWCIYGFVSIINSYACNKL